MNLGHTFGHVIEHHLGYGQWLHGEAVAVGICMAFELSVRLKWISQVDADRVRNLLIRAELPVTLPIEFALTSDQFISAMHADKKVVDRELRLVLPKGKFGQCQFTKDYDPSLLKDTLEYFLQNKAPASE